MLSYIIAYDITCDRRRKKVSDLLEGYGKRVQYSVFECVLTAAQFYELKKRLKKRIKPEEDNLRFYPLSKHTWTQVETWGTGFPLTEYPGSTIV